MQPRWLFLFATPIKYLFSIRGLPLQSENLLKMNDIPIRDPFVLPIIAEQQYYVYGTTGSETWTNHASGII
ncbi:MAG: hypothetical protein F9K46_07535 [Anaerolineae bacterium]|nr:MAG: hypothetical protein F9K46_07535 [Anaerolineae bacterium]